MPDVPRSASRRSRRQAASITPKPEASRRTAGSAPNGPASKRGVDAKPTDVRRAIFAAVVAACLVLGGAYVALTAAGRRPSVGQSVGTPPITSSVPSGRVAQASPAVPGSAEPAASVQPSAGATGSTPPHAGQVIFQSVIRDPSYAKVAMVPVSDPSGPRTVTNLTCERVYFGGGNGLCLVPENGLVSTYHAITFGPDFAPRSELELGGAPSRARVSSDGRYGASTVFVFGHSYADIYFSTQTILIDMASGTSLADVEKAFSVTRDGQPFMAQDFNFWGITFGSDSDNIYATLRTGGQNYLVHGSVSKRSFAIVHDAVECPSLSPDGTRIAFKKRMQNGIGSGWRLYVLDIATGNEKPLGESRDIDDQPEWLDNGHVLYGVEGSIWTVPADGTGSPSLFLKDALSPAVVR